MGGANNLGKVTNPHEYNKYPYLSMSKLFGRFESPEVSPTHLLSNGNVVRKRPVPPRETSIQCKILMQIKTVYPYTNRMALTKLYTHLWKGNYILEKAFCIRQLTVMICFVFQQWQLLCSEIQERIKKTKVGLFKFTEPPKIQDIRQYQYLILIM